jgi:hypothetical protein
MVRRTLLLLTLPALLAACGPKRYYSKALEFRMPEGVVRASRRDAATQYLLNSRLCEDPLKRPMVFEVWRFPPGTRFFADFNQQLEAYGYAGDPLFSDVLTFEGAYDPEKEVRASYLSYQWLRYENGKLVRRVVGYRRDDDKGTVLAVCLVATAD